MYWGCIVALSNVALKPIQASLSPEKAARATGQPVTGLPGTGNWYAGNGAGQKMVAWLCPALYEYFAEAPKKIFVKAEKPPVGGDPIWHISSNDPQARRYMSAEPSSR
jgi:hypothetical protein